MKNYFITIIQPLVYGLLIGIRKKYILIGYARMLFN